MRNKIKMTILRSQYDLHINKLYISYPMQLSNQDSMFYFSLVPIGPTNKIVSKNKPCLHRKLWYSWTYLVNLYTRWTDGWVQGFIPRIPSLCRDVICFVPLVGCYDTFRLIYTFLNPSRHGQYICNVNNYCLQ